MILYLSSSSGISIISSGIMMVSFKDFAIETDSRRLTISSRSSLVSCVAVGFSSSGTVTPVIPSSVGSKVGGVGTTSSSAKHVLSVASFTGSVGASSCIFASTTAVGDPDLVKSTISDLSPTSSPCTGLVATETAIASSTSTGVATGGPFFAGFFDEAGVVALGFVAEVRDVAVVPRGGVAGAAAAILACEAAVGLLRRSTALLLKVAFLIGVGN